MNENPLINPAEITEQFRDNCDAFVDHCINSAIQLYPASMEGEFIRFTMAFYLSKAFLDARELDANAHRSKKAATFLREFVSSVFCDLGFMPVLHEYAQMPTDRRALRAYSNAIELGAGKQGAVIMHLLREKLKDGWTMKAALASHGESIGREFSAGNVALLTLLTKLREQQLEIQPKAEAGLQKDEAKLYEPSVQRWLIKAWLPLALWQDVLPKEKDRRIRAAWEVMKSTNVELPALPPLPEGKEGSFEYPLQGAIRAAQQEIRERRTRTAKI